MSNLMEPSIYQGSTGALSEVRESQRGTNLGGKGIAEDARYRVADAELGLVTGDCLEQA